jgi:hypothetical protein
MNKIQRPEFSWEFMICCSISEFVELFLYSSAFYNEPGWRPRRGGGCTRFAGIASNSGLSGPKLKPAGVTAWFSENGVISRKVRTDDCFFCCDLKRIRDNLCPGHVLPSQILQLKVVLFQGLQQVSEAGTLRYRSGLTSRWSSDHFKFCNFYYYF